jgi:kanamycin kinase/aminoglycoside 3'-phosphotransferase-2
VSRPEGELPQAIADLVGGARLSRVDTGDSEAEVLRVEGGLYLKVVSRNPVLGGLSRERDRTEWLSGRLPVPEVRAFVQDDARDYLLMTEIPGRNASPEIGRGGLPWLVDAVAEGCRRLHSIDGDDCPFAEHVDSLLEAARQRMERGLVVESDFDEERRGRNARELFDELLDLPRPEDDLVFTHGDLCLPNILVGSGRVTGFVDLGGAGISDRWRDLALTTRSITRNLGRSRGDAFLEAYGAAPNPGKLHFFRLLDEFF